MTIEDTTMGWRFINPVMRQQYGVDTMPETAEAAAREYAISRDAQDAFALRSQQRVAASYAKEVFTDELLPVRVPQRRGEDILFIKDEHPRETSLQDLARLKGVVRPEGSVTAGNASGINDGACALLVASEAGARRHDLVPRARIIASAAAGVEPRFMGMGPVPAVEKVLQRAGLALAQMDVIELNEAFAAQALAVLQTLHIEPESPRVKPNGGAIALGHPLGASGARLVTTAYYQLLRTRGRYALCTMCVGVGQGIAVIIERL